MAFAAVIFGAAHPIGSAFAALFFAVVGAIGIRAQLSFGDKVPHDLLQALRRYGIAKIEGAEDPLQPYHVVIRAGIVDVLGESALLQLAAHGVDPEEGSDEAA